METLETPVMTISLTDLARDTSWRKNIDELGILGINDRRGRSIAYVLSPAEFEHYSQLVQSDVAKKEESEIRAIFEMRKGDDVVPSAQLQDHVNDIVAGIAQKLAKLDTEISK